MPLIPTIHSPFKIKWFCFIQNVPFIQCRAIQKDYSLFDIVTGTALFATLSRAFHIAHSFTPLPTEALYLTYSIICISSTVFSQTETHLVLNFNYSFISKKFTLMFCLVLNECSKVDRWLFRLLPVCYMKA